MAIDCDKLLNWRFPEERHTFTRRDVMLYALSIGFGVPATDVRQLPFVYERQLRALPTMACILGYRGFWMQDPAAGVDWRRVLHGQQKIILHQPLPVEGTILSRQYITALIDKGVDRGAVLGTRRDIFDSDGREMLASVDQISLLRGDGGFGRSSGSVPPFEPVPMRAPDRCVDLPTLAQTALIYRLSGDYNPLHVDPAIAIEAGFACPPLHGLCTFGIACHALLRCCMDYQPDRLRSLEGRFTAPVFPGETIRTELWIESEARVHARARALERDVIVFDHGLAELRPQVADLRAPRPPAD